MSSQCSNQLIHSHDFEIFGLGYGITNRSQSTRKTSNNLFDFLMCGVSLSK